ncbi:MAG: methyl-accepting chemotaxis protein [Actinobacteria bacterium]|nr:MAG: methyl-accepting chemotaxis protein [Actinomycetota bacterium]
MQDWLKGIRSRFLFKYCAANGVMLVFVAVLQAGVVYALARPYMASPEAVDKVAFLGGLSFLGFVLAYSAGSILVGSRLIRPLNEVGDSIAAACSGDLGRKVTRIPKDELGELAKNYNQMIDLVIYLIKQTHESGQRLSAASSQILASSEQQASGSAEQAASIAQTTATMEELAATYRQIAENANSVVSTAERTQGSAESGQQAMMNTVVGMEEIKKRTQSSANKILVLGEKSQQIGSVLSIINDIADQTKILALNAAIEAARAGEAGKGFSVVAVEIRKLAESVVESTQEIRKIMTEIQSSTNALVMSTEEEIKKVDEGVELAQMTGESLAKVLEMIEKTTEAAKEISIATQQQRSASDQVVTAMKEVAAVATQSANGSRDVAMAAEQLAQLAKDAAQVGSAFRLGE